jgi:integrase
MPIFICPNCGDRSVSTERTAGFQDRARACKKCGFGFLFELLDDYYPAPDAAFFTCDKEARVLDVGEDTLVGQGVHLIRRSMARVFYEQLKAAGHGDPTRVVMAMLGHANARTTEIYLGIRQDREERNELLLASDLLWTEKDNNVVQLRKVSGGDQPEPAV